MKLGYPLSKLIFDLLIQTLDLIKAIPDYSNSG